MINRQGNNGLNQLGAVRSFPGVGAAVQVQGGAPVSADVRG